MQITETSNEGLKRTLKVVVGADELGRRFTERLGEIKDRVQLKGFRKGKVPVPHLKKVFGRSLMAEVLQEAVKETTNKALADRNERPAMQPSVNLPEDQAEIERVLAGEADLAYSVTFEVLPKIELADFTALKLERLVADVEPEAIDKAVADLADRGTTWTPEEGRAAASGDRLTVDFVGRIGEEAFEGGSAEDAQIVLGQGSFIPGFEEGPARRQGGRGALRGRDLPGRLSRRHARRQGGDLRRHDQGGGGAGASPRSTTSSPRPSAWRRWRSSRRPSAPRSSASTTTPPA